VGYGQIETGCWSGNAAMITLSVNGKSYNLDVEDDAPLLWVLRDTIGLTGTKYGCGIAQCGACTVLIDGTPTRSCQVPAGSLAGRSVTTIEALAQHGNLHPTDADIDAAITNICRCGSYQRVRAAIHAAAKA
jgi:isoquinoline 1-oxidoreductase alpha subunit